MFDGAGVHIDDPVAFDRVESGLHRVGFDGKLGFVAVMEWGLGRENGADRNFF